MPTKVDENVLSDIAKRNTQQQETTVETPIVAPAVTTEQIQNAATPKEAGILQRQAEIQTEVSPEKAQEKPAYFADYSNDTNLWEIAKRNNKPLQDVFTDYQKWGKETGNNTDFLTMWNVAQKGNVTKTPEQIEKDAKKAERQEKFEKIGNFLSHLGNFIGTAAFGAPSQTLEPAQQLTARQQAVREKTEALRRVYNDRFFENYWKQRADERKAEQLENDNRKQDRLDVQQRLLARKQDWLEKYQQGTLDLKSEKQDIDRQLAEGKISKMERDAAIAELNAQTRRISANTSAAREARLANGTETDTTVTKQTPFGKQTTTTKKSTRPAGSFSKKPQRKKIDY